MGYDSGYSLSDIAAATGNRGNNDGFGDGMGAWWIIIFLIFALGGWGNGNWGGNGGSNGRVMDAYVLNSDFATLQRIISDGFSATTAGINQVNNGLCQGFYQQAQLVNGIQQTLCQEFGNTINAIQQNGYETRLGTQNLSSQLANCCCDIREGISGVNYNMAINNNALQASMCNNTRDIIDSQTNGTRAILDAITANRIEDKNAQIQAQQNEINALRLAASQERQTNYLYTSITDKLSPCPVPAYLTCNPNANYSLNQLFSNNCCGCGC